MGRSIGWGQNVGDAHQKLRSLFVTAFLFALNRNVVNTLDGVLAELLVGIVVPRVELEQGPDARDDIRRRSRLGMSRM